MDIEYLLILQNLRNSLGQPFEQIAVALSDFSVSVWPILIIAVIFWMFEKRTGVIWFRCFAIGEFVNGIAKLTACIYRPWINDARVLPAGDSLTTATGYSFPSGHSTRAAFLYGFGALWQFAKKKPANIIVGIVLLVIMLLTMFSRNFLGVHTPQDVIFGLLATTLVILLSIKIQDWLDKGKITPKELLIGAIALVLIGFIYVSMKTYPLDYVDGKLLVDPEKMKPDTIQSFGMLLGFAIGHYIEQRWIKFTPDKKSVKAWIAVAVGLILIFLCHEYFSAFLTAFIGKSMGKFFNFFIIFLIIFAVIPAVLKTIEVRSKNTNCQQAEKSIN